MKKSRKRKKEQQHAKEKKRKSHIRLKSHAFRSAGLNVCEILSIRGQVQGEPVCVSFTWKYERRMKEKKRSQPHYVCNNTQESTINKHSRTAKYERNESTTHNA